MLVVGGYKRGERGREAPKSLLGEKLSVASSVVRARSECVLRVTCVAWRSKVIVLPRIGGAQWQNTVVSTLYHTGE